MAEMQVISQGRQVHVILDDGCSECHEVETCRKPQSSSHSYDGLVAARTFERAASWTRSIASTMIHHEVAQVNKRLLSVQQRVNKRRKLDNENHRKENVAASSDRSDIESVVSAEEQSSIWDQAERMKRMAILLRQLEETQHMLAQEMRSCAAANDLVKVDYASLDE